MDFLKKYLAEDLSRVRSHMDRIFTVDGELMATVADHVRDSGGKLLRPSMVCLFARAHSHDPADDRHTRLGASIELFHVATLLHDDVIDNATERRGRPAVNAKWGNDVAILFADYLYASSFDLALSTLSPEVMRILTKTTQRMTEGEMYQIQKRGDWLVVEDYLKIIRSKTAYLFAACSGLGTLIAGASPEQVARMTDFGFAFGMAFQITDDTLDYEAQEDRWGKRVGADVQEGKQTLPLLYTLSRASDTDRAELIHTLGNGRDFETIHHHVRKYGGIEFSLERAAEFTKEATDVLDELDPASDAVIHLRAMTEGVLVRQF